MVLKPQSTCLVACSEMYEAVRWHEDTRFFSPMVEHNGEFLFVGDFVTVKDTRYGDCVVKVWKFTQSVYVT